MPNAIVTFRPWADHPRQGRIQAMIRIARCWPACALVLWTGTARAEDPALEVTTDTVVYCSELHGPLETLMRASGAASQQVRDLSEEGQRMCDQGLARGGVLRLRRALSLIARPGE